MLLVPVLHISYNGNCYPYRQNSLSKKEVGIFNAVLTNDGRLKKCKVCLYTVPN